MNPVQSAPSPAAQSCPICNSRESSKYWAIIAPFIRNYVRPSRSSLLNLCECRNCQHRYFDYRYSDAEMDRLYREYRSQSYLAARHHVEPWYGRKANTENLNPATVNRRLLGIRSFVRPFLLSEEHHLIIADLGGDAGQFIPLDLAREAYVIEASQQQPVQGVTRVVKLSDLTSDVGLLICSHVLEHIPDPLTFLRLQLSSPQVRPGCLVYLEVPMERYALSPALGSGLYSRYLKCILKMPIVLLCIDFLSVVSRSFLGVIMPPLILKMHEHINFFSAQSLRIMIKSLGLVLLDIGVESESNMATHQGVIRALARK